MELYTHTSEPGITYLKVYSSDFYQLQEKTDTIAIEEPLEIQLIGAGDILPVPISITMRTPGQDENLALGFLFTEGILKDSQEVEKISFPDENMICVHLVEGKEYDLQKMDRNFYATSSCGVCGKASIDAIHTLSLFDIHQDQAKWDPTVFRQLPDMLREHQSLFSQTGGIHAAGLFTQTGEQLILREDVGRHNALDKIIGEGFSKGVLPFRESILMLSGRASFELVQKAAMAGIPVIAAIGAPSSLAVSLATEKGITLIGFLKESSFNIYSGHERLSF
ncbi:MAG: formate dehydrogenase accessory sulfurtransferase FdhD [Bacteroidota bacterium]